MPKLEGWEIEYFRREMERELTEKEIEEIRKWAFSD